MKNNNLSYLSDVLYEQLEKLSNSDLNEEQLNAQIKKTEVINRVADTIIKNGELQFKALKMGSEAGIINTDQVKFLLAPAKKSPKEIEEKK